MAEDLLTGAVPLSVVRPAIVESALRHPYPGWIDGFKMADPLIIAFGRGILPEFPGLPDGVLDIIPVDLVVNAILAAVAAPPPAERPAYYHVGSGARNPLTFRAMYDNVRAYFTEHPMPDGGRGQIKVPTWEFPGARRVERMLRTGERVARRPRNGHCWPPARPAYPPLAGRPHPGAGQARLPAPVRRPVRRVHRGGGALHRQPAAGAAPQPATGPGGGSRVRRGGHRLAALPATGALPGDHGHGPTGHRRRAATAAARRRCPAGRPGGAGRSPTGGVRPGGHPGRVQCDRDLPLARLADTPRGRWPAELVDLLRSLPRYLAAERRDRGEFLRSFLRRYAGRDEAALHRLVHERLAEALLRRTYPQAIRQVRRHRAAGHRTILVTGTVDVLVSPLAPLFDEVVASRLHTRAGRYTGFLESPPLVGEARAAWLRRYADTAGVDLARSYAYCDSYSDRPLLEAVGNPVAVNPDAAAVPARALAAVAGGGVDGTSPPDDALWRPRPP